MKTEEFNNLNEALDKMCRAVLEDRTVAYADEDRLENFKQIAALTQLTPQQVCIVLQSKHFVALSKAIREGRYSRCIDYMVDIINYQKLLNALINEGPSS